jgi:hypothetical protein
MIGELHYSVDFVTFYEILGFGVEHRDYKRIHSNKDPIDAHAHELRHVWKNPNCADVGKSKGLKGIYYVMNKLIRNTINPQM